MGSWKQLVNDDHSWIVNQVEPTDGSEYEDLLSACRQQYRESMERSWLGKEEILDEPALDTIHKESLAEVMNTFKSSAMKTVNATLFLSFRDELHCQLREDFKIIIIANETKKRNFLKKTVSESVYAFKMELQELHENSTNQPVEEEKLNSTISSIKSRVLQQFRSKVSTFWTDEKLLEEEISFLESTLDNEQRRITIITMAKGNNRTILTNNKPTENFRAADEDLIFTQNMQILEDNLGRLNNAVNTETESDINKEVNVSRHSNNNYEPNQMIDNFPGMYNSKDLADQIIRNGAEDFKKNYDTEMRKALEQGLNEMHAQVKEKQLLGFRQMLQKCGVHDDDGGRLLLLDKELDSQLTSFKVRLDSGGGGTSPCANGIFRNDIHKTLRPLEVENCVNLLFWATLIALVLWDSFQLIRRLFHMF
jgi:hypothetical protein